MSISLQADSTLPQGYILVDGQRVASVSTTGGLSATLAANTVTTSSLVSGSVTTEKIAPGAVVTADLADGAVTTQKLSQPYTLATAKAWNWNNSSSNTFIDFENIPSWAKRVTVMFSGVSTSGTQRVQVQLGTSSGIETSGYLGTVQWSTSRTNFSTGFLTTDDASGVAGYARNGLVTLHLIGLNTWAAAINIGLSNQNDAWYGGGSKTLSGVLDRVRITGTSPSTDVFDAGTINISYE